MIRADRLEQFVHDLHTLHDLSFAESLSGAAVDCVHGCVEGFQEAFFGDTVSSRCDGAGRSLLTASMNAIIWALYPCRLPIEEFA